MIFIYAIIALLITFILVPILIPTLKRMKFGQSIREEGPQSHMKKTGTPTMGGLTFLISIIITSIIAIISVNLTDGLDGLATGLSIIGFAMYAVMSYMLDSPAIGIFCIIMIFALLGFLPYNLNPAKVFMGDTGSLALGGIFATISIMLNQELSLILIGFVFVVETLSVMLQVASYKLTKKRIFKMSPIHHHFELSGWGEWKVVTVFWTVGLITGLIGLWIGVH